jgi:hypothetical protein
MTARCPATRNKSSTSAFEVPSPRSSSSVNALAVSRGLKDTVVPSLICRPQVGRVRYGTKPILQWIAKQRYSLSDLRAFNLHHFISWIRSRLLACPYDYQEWQPLEPYLFASKEPN